MAVKNAIWPVTALTGTLAIFWAYFCYGRLAPMRTHHHAGAASNADAFRFFRTPAERAVEIGARIDI